jgi:predicted nucleic acid-binding OB-fold protein
MVTKKESTNANVQDAITLLTADHKAVKALFKEYEGLKEQDDADEEKAILVQRICTELTTTPRSKKRFFTRPCVRRSKTTT